MFRPYLPRLPFKVGNTIKSGGLLGRVEATTFSNTRMRTFDGKTVWIPNNKLFKDYLLNYHYTLNRKIHLDVHKPKGFRVHFQRMNEDDPQTDFIPDLDQDMLDSDVVAWRSAWKLYQATQSDEPDFGNGRLANIYVVDEEGRPVKHYATGKLDVYNPK